MGDAGVGGGFQQPPGPFRPSHRHTLLKGLKGVAWTIGREPGHGEEGCDNLYLVAWMVL